MPIQLLFHTFPLDVTLQLAADEQILIRSEARRDILCLWLINRRQEKMMNNPMQQYFFMVC